MRCLMCGRWSVSHLCHRCRHDLLRPHLSTRKLSGGFPVYSFYRYDEIEALLHTKHTDLGFYIYRVLAQNALAPFARQFRYPLPVAALGVDDHARHGYAHTALLARALRSASITPRYGRLRAASNDAYSGQTFQYRLLHPRRFSFRSFPEQHVILVDDIVTTGLTLTEAAETLRNEGKEPLFCITLSDVGYK